MSTLYKRATPAQARVLAIVAGAIINTAHAHPEWKVDKRFARSAAKRAAGTLTAQWPEVLAAVGPRSPDRGRGQFGSREPQPQAPRAAKARGGHVGTAPAVRPARHPFSRRALRALKQRVGYLAGVARRAGNVERAAGLADACRLIAAMEET